MMWDTHTSSMKEINVGYISVVTHTPIVWRLWSGNVMYKSFVVLKHLPFCCSHTPQQVVSQSWFVLIGERERDLGVRSLYQKSYWCCNHETCSICNNKYIGCRRLTLERDIVGFKYEWLSPTSTINKQNVGYIREMANILNALKFCIEMWCQKSLVVLKHLDCCSCIPELPNRAKGHWFCICRTLKYLVDFY